MSRTRARLFWLQLAAVLLAAAPEADAQLSTPDFDGPGITITDGGA